MALNAKHRWSTATSTIKERRVVTKEVAKRYQRVRKRRERYWLSLSLLQDTRGVMPLVF